VAGEVPDPAIFRYPIRAQRVIDEARQRGIDLKGVLRPYPNEAFLPPREGAGGHLIKLVD
jgi:hypothetical protein